MLKRVVICGSFHRDPIGLQRLVRELEMTNCRILSPVSVNFMDTSLPVVRAASENQLAIGELERFHLRSMRECDLIWLHAPLGHVGISTSYELGFAAALQKPVFSLCPPDDEMLASQVTAVQSVFEALDSLPCSRTCQHQP